MKNYLTLSLLALSFALPMTAQAQPVKQHHQLKESVLPAAPADRDGYTWVCSDNQIRNNQRPNFFDNLVKTARNTINGGRCRGEFVEVQLDGPENN